MHGSSREGLPSHDRLSCQRLHSPRCLHLPVLSASGQSMTPGNHRVHHDHLSVRLVIGNDIHVGHAHPGAEPILHKLCDTAVSFLT